MVASFLGKRNYNRFEVEQTVGEQISAQTGWTHRQRRRDQVLQGSVSLTVRVHIDGGEAVLGIRLADRPMHRRAWKERDTPGTLHPPVAAAMGLVAGIRPGVIVADPFCGSGTIGIEIALDEPTAHTFMSDLENEAVKTTRHNASVADVADRAVIARADGVLPPLRPSSVDRIVSNTPWGKAVKVEGGLQGGWTSFVDAMAEVVGDRGRMVLLVDTEEAAALTAAAEDVGWSVLDRFQLAVSGMWAMMVVLGVGHHAQVIDTRSQFGPELVAELEAHQRGSAVG